MLLITHEGIRSKAFYFHKKPLNCVLPSNGLCWKVETSLGLAGALSRGANYIDLRLRISTSS